MGVAGIGLPRMVPGPRMEEGTEARGNLETRAVLKGMGGRAWVKPELQRVEEAFPSLSSKQRRGPWSARRPPRSGGEVYMRRNVKSVSRRQQQNKNYQ